MNKLLPVCLLPAVIIFLNSCSNEAEPEALRAMMAEKGREAVIEAGKKYKTTLGYEFSSIKTVDSILGIIHDSHTVNYMTDEYIIEQAAMWGAYVGETIKRKRRSHWEQDSEIGLGTFPIVTENNKVFPISWCYKRIKYGKEDDIWIKTLNSLGK